MPDQAGDLLEIQQRRKAVSERYIRGETQWAIARALEVGQATICRDLEAIRGEWLKSSLVNFNERRAEEIAKLDALERECWLAWQRSCQPKKTSSNKRRASLSTDSKGGSSETFLREEMRDGNPRFLEATLKCIEKRCQLLGLLEKDKKGEPPPDEAKDANQPNPLFQRIQAYRALLGEPELGGPGIHPLRNGHG